MKAETRFQADPVSQDASRSFTKDPEEQKGGAQTPKVPGTSDPSSLMSSQPGTGMLL